MTDQQKKAIPEGVRHLYDFPNGWISSWVILDQREENGASRFLVSFASGKFLLLEDGRAVLYPNADHMAAGKPSGVLFIEAPTEQRKGAR